VLSFSYDKSLLAPLVYRLVNNGLFKVSPDFHQSLLLGRVTYWLLVCSCMQPQVLYSTMLRCRWVGGHKSSEIKSGVSWRRNSTVERARWTGTTLVYWPAYNLLKHNRNLKKWRLFPVKPDCQTCVVDRRAVYQWCYGCYSNCAGDSRPIPNF